MSLKIASILIAIAILFTIVNTAHAQVVADFTITDYNPESETWIGILNIDNEQVNGIIVNRADQKSANEDDLSSDSITLNNDRSFDYNGITFVYTVITKTVAIDADADTINGVNVQFNSPVTTGSAILVRDADAYAQHNGFGIIIQDNKVITFAAFNNEKTYHTFMPMIASK